MSAGLLRTRLANLALFQAGWFACVLGAASGRPWSGAGLGLILVLAHLVLVRDRVRELKLLTFALFLGIVVDTVHMRTGALVFFGGGILPGSAPPWILVLWMQLAATLRFSLSWLAGRYAVAGILGACSGALAYGAGVRLGAAALGTGTALLQVGLSWGFALPLLMFVAHKTAGRREAERYRLLG